MVMLYGNVAVDDRNIIQNPQTANPMASGVHVNRLTGQVYAPVNPYGYTGAAPFGAMQGLINQLLAPKAASQGYSVGAQSVPLQGGVSTTAPPTVNVSTTVPAGGDRIFAPSQVNSNNSVQNQTVNPYSFPGMPNFQPLKAVSGAPQPSPIPGTSLPSPIMQRPTSGGRGSAGGRVPEAQAKTAIALPGQVISGRSGEQGGAPDATPFLTGPGGTRIPLPTNRMLQGGVSSGINPMAPNLMAAAPPMPGAPGRPNTAIGGTPLNQKGQPTPLLGKPMTPKMDTPTVPEVQGPTPPVPTLLNPNGPQPTPYDKTVQQERFKQQVMIQALTEKVAEYEADARHWRGMIENMLQHTPEDEMDSAQRVAEQVNAALATNNPLRAVQMRASGLAGYVQKNATDATEKAQARETSAWSTKLSHYQQMYTNSMEMAKAARQSMDTMADKNTQLLMDAAKTHSATPSEMTKMYEAALDKPVGAVRDAYLKGMEQALQLPAGGLESMRWIPQNPEAAAKLRQMQIKNDFLSAMNPMRLEKAKMTNDKTRQELDALPKLLSQRIASGGNKVQLQEIQKKIQGIHALFTEQLDRSKLMTQNASSLGAQAGIASKNAYAAGQLVQKFSKPFELYANATDSKMRLQIKSIIAQQFPIKDKAGKIVGSEAIDKNGELRVPDKVVVAMRQLQEQTDIIEKIGNQAASDMVAAEEGIKRAAPPAPKAQPATAPAQQSSNGLVAPPPATAIQIPAAHWKKYFSLPPELKERGRKDFMAKYGIDPDGR